MARKEAVNGSACIEDEVVYGWAVHYFDEDNVELNKEHYQKAKVEPKVEPKVEAKVEVKQEIKPIVKAKKSKEEELYGQGIFEFIE